MTDKITPEDVAEMPERIRIAEVGGFDPITGQKRTGLKVWFGVSTGTEYIRADLVERQQLDVEALKKVLYEEWMKKNPATFGEAMDNAAKAISDQFGSPSEVARLREVNKDLSPDAFEMMQGMIEFCIEHGYRMGMDGGRDENGNLHPAVQELQALAAAKAGE